MSAFRRETSFHPNTEWISAVLLYLVLLAVTIVYWPGLSGSFFLDDEENLRRLTTLEYSSENLSTVLVNKNAGPTGRPVAMASFALNQVASGGDPFAFKYTNLMIHLLVGVMLFWLTGRLLKLAGVGLAWLMAAAVAGCWLLAPIQISTVLYTIQRMTQLAALFAALGMLSYLYGRESLEKTPRRGVTLILTALLAWLPLGIFSKEAALLLPLFLLLLELHFFQLPQTKSLRVFMLLLLVTSLLLPGLWFIGKIAVDPEFILSSYHARSFTLTERLLTESRVLFDYLRNILIPDAPYLGVIHDDFPISKGLFKPISTIFSLLGWLSILLVAALLFRKHDTRALSFGILFFLAGHLLESTIFPLELYFEHRNYLPSWGIFFFVVVGLDHLSRRQRIRHLTLYTLFGLALLYGFTSYQRTQTWSSSQSMLLSAATAHPQSLRLNTAMAHFYMQNGHLDEALNHLRTAQQVAPHNELSPFLYPFNAYCWAGTTPPEAVYRNLESRLTGLEDKAPAAAWSFAFKMLARAAEATGCTGLDSERLHRMIQPWFLQIAMQTNRENIKPMCTSIGYFFHTVQRDDLGIPFLSHCWEAGYSDLYIGLLKLRYQLKAGDLDDARTTLSQIKSSNTEYQEGYRNTIDYYAAQLRGKMPRNDSGESRQPSQ